MFLDSNCTCAVNFTYTAHVQLLAKNMAATHVHAFAYAFAYAIKQTPYAFVAKIILCMSYSMLWLRFVVNRSVVLGREHGIFFYEKTISRAGKC